jgi:threonine synthase
MAKDFLLKYKGECLTVTDDEIIEASSKLSKNTGIFSEPAACAAFAAMLKYNIMNKLKKSEKNVVLLTGSGLKDVKAVSSLIKIPEAIPASIDAVINLLNTQRNAK